MSPFFLLEISPLHPPHFPAAGLVEGGTASSPGPRPPLPLVEQLAALVEALKSQQPTRGDVAVYLTTQQAQPLQRPGDFLLRASTTQRPGWLALEFIPPSQVGRGREGEGKRGGGEGGWGRRGGLVCLARGAGFFYIDK